LQLVLLLLPTATAVENNVPADVVHAAVVQVGGVLYIIGACLWTLEAVASWWCLKTVRPACVM
jgi:hypothetical protein